MSLRGKRKAVKAGLLDAPAGSSCADMFCARAVDVQLLQVALSVVLSLEM